MTPDLSEASLPTTEVRTERSFRFSRVDLAISFGILLASALCYARVAGFGFVNQDDPFYVYSNPHLSEGFSATNLKWIFLSFYPDYWFPLTRLSFVLDYKLFGLAPAGYHIENVVIHAFAAIALFGFLQRATGVRWPSAFTGFIFAIHPLHVESVAWVAERKDVLCAFLWFAALWAWSRYVEAPKWDRYAAALGLFILGLTAKPMIVTLPALLFLLDVWPFRRPVSRKTIFEKIPFLILSAAGVALASVASRGALQPLSILPLGQRIGNALISLPIYIGDALWPARLWGIYSFPSIEAWQVVTAAAALIAATALAVWQVRSRPYLTVGWFWFLVTLAPVIGLTQAGQQARADRFMYVPLVGLSLMLAWSAREILETWPRSRGAAVPVAAAICVALAARTWFQTAYWKDTDALFQHAIEMDSRNYLALTDLAQAHSEQPQYADRVIAWYREAVRIRPDFALSHNLLGMALAREGHYPAAISEYRETLRIFPEYAPARYNLGAAFMRIGRKQDAVAEFAAVLRINPDFPPALNDLGVALITTPGRFEEGLRYLERAVRDDPDYALAQYDLGRALMIAPGRFFDAATHFEDALRLNPRYADAHLGLAAVLMRDPERKYEAISHLKAAQAIAPNPNVQNILDKLQKSQASATR